VWCAIEVCTDRQWTGLTAALGKPEWAADARFATQDGRLAHRDVIEELLRSETARFDVSDLASRLQSAGVPASPVETNADVLADPQLCARGYWQNVPHAEMGTIIANLPPFQMSGQGRPPPGPPPLLGEHTREIAKDWLGLDAAEIDRLTEQQVFY
jgi:benzylsuccinate CoA-transferase BbsF subunit